MSVLWKQWKLFSTSFQIIYSFSASYTQLNTWTFQTLLYLTQKKWKTNKFIAFLFILIQPICIHNTRTHKTFGYFMSELWCSIYSSWIPTDVWFGKKYAQTRETNVIFFFFLLFVRLLFVIVVLLLNFEYVKNSIH